MEGHTNKMNSVLLNSNFNPLNKLICATLHNSLLWSHGKNVYPTPALQCQSDTTLTKILYEYINIRTTDGNGIIYIYRHLQELLSFDAQNAAP